MANFLHAANTDVRNEAIGAADKFPADHIFIVHKNAPFAPIITQRGM
jgi:hypothetical protein